MLVHPRTHVQPLSAGVQPLSAGVQPLSAGGHVTSAVAGAFLLAVLLVAGCSSGPDRPPTPASAATEGLVREAGATGSTDAVPPHELVLTGDLRGLAADRADAADAVVELRVVVAGPRTHVSTSVGGTLVDQHVFTARSHWLWIPPDLRTALVDAEWVHLDVGALADAGLPLPRHVAAARGAVPLPAEVAVGDVVAGMEVLEVDELAGDAVRLAVAGVPAPLVLRHRLLPAGTEVSVPTGAVDASEVRGLLGG